MAKITVNYADILRIATRAKAVVPKRSPLPITQNLHLRVTDGTLTIMATDCGTYYRESVAGRSDGSFDLCVNAHDFFIAVKGTGKSAEITLEIGDNSIQIESSNGANALKTMPSDAFPEFPEPKGDLIYSGSALSRALELGSIARSKDPAKPGLCGVCIHGLPAGMIRAVSTDGFRLAVSECEGKASEKETQTPVSAEFAKLLADVADGTFATLSRDDNWVWAMTGDVELAHRYLHSSFPGYEKVLPSAFKHEFVFDRKAIKSALADLVKAQGEHEHHARIAYASGYARIEVENDGNVSSRTVPCTCDVDNFEIALDTRYMLDVAKAYSGKDLIIKFNDNSGQVQFEEEGTRYVLMPVTFAKM